MLVLEKISNYLLIVKKLRGLGIDFLAWKCIRRLKNGDYKSFSEDSKCTDEGFRQQSFERRRKQAWRSFLRLLSINIQRLSNSDIYTLVEKMTTVIDNLNMLEKLLLQLIKASSQFTSEKTEREDCIKKCDTKYNNNTKLADYLSAFIISTVSGILYWYGVSLDIILLSAFSLALVVLVARFLIWRSYETCIDGCNKENRINRIMSLSIRIHIMSLLIKIDEVMKDLNYVVDEISRLLGVSSSSASTERVAYSGYRT
jgi:hypothetical protein